MNSKKLSKHAFFSLQNMFPAGKILQNVRLVDVSLLVKTILCNMEVQRNGEKESNKEEDSEEKEIGV